MSLPVIVIDVGMVAFSALLLWAGPRMWRNEGGPYTDAPPSRWRSSLAAWRAQVRTLARVTPLIMVFGGPAFVLASTGANSPWVAIPAIVLGCAATLVIFVGLPAVYLWNRPKWLVAPHLRHQPGYIDERAGSHVDPTPPPQKPGQMITWAGTLEALERRRARRESRKPPA